MHSSLVTQEAEDRQNVIVYGNDCKDGKKLSCAYMDTLLIKNKTVVTIISGRKEVEQWDIKTGKKLETFPISRYKNIRLVTPYS